DYRSRNPEVHNRVDVLHEVDPVDVPREVDPVDVPRMCPGTKILALSPRCSPGMSLLGLGPTVLVHVHLGTRSAYSRHSPPRRASVRLAPSHPCSRKWHPCCVELGNC